jgi:hypothetical protein
LPKYVIAFDWLAFHKARNLNSDDQLKIGTCSIFHVNLDRDLPTVMRNEQNPLGGTEELMLRKERDFLVHGHIGDPDVACCGLWNKADDSSNELSEFTVLVRMLSRAT